MSFANAPVAAVHALAYPIGGHFKVPHGMSCSLMFSPVLKFNTENSPVAAKAYAEIAPIVFPELLREGSGSASGSAAASGSPAASGPNVLRCVLFFQNLMGRWGITDLGLQDRAD